MIYEYEKTKKQYPAQFNLQNPWANVSGNPSVQASGGTAGGAQEISQSIMPQITSGVLNAVLPGLGAVVPATSAISKAAYSANNPVGDAAGSLFGYVSNPLGGVMQGIDIGIKGEMPSGEKIDTAAEQAEVAGLSILSAIPGLNMIPAAIWGEQRRDRERRQKKMVDFVNRLNRQAGAPEFDYEKPKLGAEGYIPDMQNIAQQLPQLIGSLRGGAVASPSRPAAPNTTVNLGQPALGQSSAELLNFSQNLTNPLGQGFNINAGMLGFKNGGLLKYEDGGSVLLPESGGVDKIALIDTESGQDTGIRVSGEEMLVISKETLSGLKNALSKGDKKKVFSLMQEQIAEKPNVKGGVEGYADGGLGTPEEELRRAQEKKKLRTQKDWTDYYQGRLTNIDATIRDIKPSDFLINSVGDFLRGTNEAEIAAAERKVELQKERENILNELQRVKSGILPGAKQVAQPETQPEASTAAALPTVTMTPSQAASGLAAAGGVGAKAAAGKKAAAPTGKTMVEQKAAEAKLKPLEMMKPFTVFGEMRRPNVQMETDRVPVYESYFAKGTGGNIFSNIQNAIGPAVETGIDALRLAEGLRGARATIPTWQPAQAWRDYVSEAGRMANMGLGSQQMANLQQQADRQYITDVANVRGLSGGNVGTLLGNLGRANMQRSQMQSSIAAMDQQARMQNQARFGAILGQDINLSRMMFGDAYTQAMMEKQAGAQLANQALQNMAERIDFERYYGPGSQQQKMNEMQLQAMQGYIDATEAQKMAALAAIQNNQYRPSGAVAGTTEKKIV